MVASVMQWLGWPGAIISRRMALLFALVPVVAIADLREEFLPGVVDAMTLLSNLAVSCHQLFDQEAPFSSVQLCVVMPG